MRRGSIPEPPFDPWASDSDDDSNANVEVITPAPRRAGGQYGSRTL